MAKRVAINERAHRESLQQGDQRRAARCAFWLAIDLLDRGEPARAGGWLARAERHLDDYGFDCVERGYPLLPIALRSQSEGDPAAALETYSRIVVIAGRFSDLDLETLAIIGQGESFLALDDSRRGVALLDEAMVAVAAGEVSPIVVGIAYCSAIETCHRTFDLGRAREWTAALSRWCDSQPDLVPYRGPCLLYRAELLRPSASARRLADGARTPAFSRQTVRYLAVAACHRRGHLAGPDKHK